MTRQQFHPSNMVNPSFCMNLEASPRLAHYLGEKIEDDMS